MEAHQVALRVIVADVNVKAGLRCLPEGRRCAVAVVR